MDVLLLTGFASAAAAEENQQQLSTKQQTPSASQIGRRLILGFGISLKRRF
jgi:hypothetical protein